MDRFCAYFTLIQKELKLFLCMLSEHEEGAEAQFHSFLISVLDRHTWPTSAALPLGNNPLYTLNKRLVGPQTQSEHCGQKKKTLAPAMNQTPHHPVHSLITTPTTLSWLPTNRFNYLILIRRYKDLNSTNIY